MTRRLQRDGYTMIEVMMAIGVMTVGAMGIMALQKASTHGNIEARQMTTATTVARSWLERLRRDSLRWNTGGNGAGAANLANTSFLKYAPADGSPSAWMTPVPPAGSNESYAFDHFGVDTLNGTANGNPAVFCVNTRYQWIFPGQAMRVDVRVWWNRLARGDNAQMSDRRDYANCGVGQEAVVGADRRLRFVSASTVLRWTPLAL